MDRRSELQYRPELRHYILPTLKYYLKLIELPNLEIENFMRHELEANPILEEMPVEETSESDESETSEDESTPEDLKEIEEFNIAELFAEVPSAVHESDPDGINPLDNVAAQGDKLNDYLLRQAFTAFQEQDLTLARLIISNIEDDGYLALGARGAIRQNHC
jgi:RNA polymerase sigma-54 factor